MNNFFIGIENIIIYIYFLILFHLDMKKKKKTKELSVWDLGVCSSQGLRFDFPRCQMPISVG